jgi:hypothetical protein
MTLENNIEFNFSKKLSIQSDDQSSDGPSLPASFRVIDKMRISIYPIRFTLYIMYAAMCRAVWLFFG